MNPMLDNTGAPPGTRAFGDIDATRSAIYKNALTAAQQYQPVANQKYSLELADAGYEGPETFTKAEEKRAVLSGGSLGRRLRGTWRLRTIDEEQKVVDEKRTTLANIPHMTPRGTFILGGNEYSMSHQMRLRPGIFTRIKESGELESHVNVARGAGHRYFLDPETGIFRIQFGQARMPLMPVLKALGATDSQIRESWGNELYSANAQKRAPQTLKKLYKKLVRSGTATDDDEMHEAIRAAFDNMTMDPEVTRRTLGKGYDKVDPEVILASTQKLLRVHKGEEGPDDRDAMAFQRTVGPEDVFAERILKANQEARRALWKATLPGNLKRLPPGMFEKLVRGAILDSGLGQCFDAETHVLTRRGFVAWPAITADDEFACQVAGCLEYHKAYQLYAYDHDGEMLGCRTRRFSYLVTPNHRLWCKAKPHSNYRPETAAAAYGKRRIFQTSLPAQRGADADFVLPAVVNKRWNKSTGALTIAGDIWAEFLGWFLAEGWVSVEKAARRWRVCISQDPAVNPEGHAAIVRVLTALPFRWKFNSSNKTFFITSKQLATELLRYGHGAENKRIPRYCFAWSRRRLGMLADAYLVGDGNEYKGYVKSETTSVGLAMDCVELYGRLGGTGRISIRRLSEKNPNWHDSYVVSFGQRAHSSVKSDSDAIRREIPKAYYRQHYRGKVYCASVPGERLYVLRDGKPHWSSNSLEEINPAELYDQRARVTRMGEGGIPTNDAVPDEARGVQPSHLGFIDPVHSPESGRIGIDSRIAIRTLKGEDGRLFSRFLEPKSGKTVWKSPQDVADAIISFPRELEKGEPFVRAQHRGKLKFVPRDKVDYELGHMTEAFGPLASMVPFKQNSFGQRVSMGSRMLTQALPMEKPESPWVQSGVPGMEGTSFEDLLGPDMGAITSGVDGTVLEVTPAHVKIRGKDGKIHNEELYDNHPYNRKTFVHNTPTVKPGDPVRAGQVIAGSNFTDAKGTTALGKNARVAYMAYKGYNFEDAIVVSESFAKKASSEHMYQHGLDLAEGTRANKNAFMAIFPGEYDQKLLDKYDDDGVLKVGEKVNMDEPMMLAVQQRQTGPKLGRRKASWSNASVIWDHHSPGVVTDVFKGKKNIGVVVKSIHPTQVGDKFAGRYGDKGVIAAIVPDEDMPHGADKKPYEVLLNPLGVISRGNPSQIIETQLGKIAALTGKAYKLSDFSSIKDLREFTERELRKHGLSDTETVTDPKTGREIKDVNVGNRFLMKLHHTAEVKLQGRATGGGYTAEGQPAKGGKSGSKRVGMLELNALLSHGAYKTIRDASIIRGQRNEDYWRMLMSGYTPPEPKVPFMYEKFVSQLKGAGINPVKSGTKLQIMAMTGNDAKKLTGDREITSAETVDWRLSKLTPIKGGMFDEKLTGGHGGTRWSHIKLQEPLPNPVMEEPIRRILGLTQKQFDETLAGRSGLPGREHMTGAKGIQQALDGINLDKELARARTEIASGKKTYRDKAVRRLQYLKSAKENKQHPRDWMMDRVPVLPPTFRPVSMFADTNTRLVNDANYLYKEVLEANKNLKDLSKITDDVTDERLAVYKAFKGVTGLGDPISPEFRDQDIKGILKHVFGTSPKFGTVQRKLLGSTVDLVGRATIIPNPNLDMDQVGLPIDEAWTLYQPFVVRRLVRRGMGKIKAMEAATERTPAALRELQSEMAERPVVVNRAPVLHRYGVMASWPQLTSSSALEVSPLTVGGFGADFDGDAMQFHVPSSEDAVAEAKEKLMPSRNLFQVSDFDVHYMPSHEYTGGLWSASTKNDDTPSRVFKTKKDAIAAYQRGEIGVGQRVQIME